MQKIAGRWPAWLEWPASLATLALLAVYTYAFFVQAPYPGFSFNSANGRVTFVHATAAPGAALRVDDQLLQIGPVAWADYVADKQLTLYDGVQPGQVVPVRVRRDNRTITVPWVFTGPTRAEVADRLISQWWMPYVFWLAGVLAMLGVRPKDARWRLLIAFNFLTAVWVSAGHVSQFHVWASPVVLRMGIWLSVPVYLFWHWLFPAPLRPLPPVARAGGYLVGVGLAAAEGLRLLPSNAYFLGFLLALAGSAGLLAAHFVLRPAQRRDIGLLAAAVALAMLPPLVLSLAGLTGQLSVLAAGATLSFPLVPFAYLYIVYRRRLGGLEVRANRLIGAYVFFILLATAVAVLVALADRWLQVPGKAALIGFGAALTAALITSLGFLPFQRFVERRLLRMPLPPASLLETYSARITTRLDRESLIGLLRDEICPSLLVRQSALIAWDEAGLPVPLYAQGVEPAQLPATPAERAALLAQAGRYRPPPEEAAQPAAWVRLALPLAIAQRPLGVWLLGRRDPDDFYAQAEIALLQALAHQTAIAFTNIVQAERLRALYQNDVDRRETERAALARELHDQVLGHLAILRLSVKDHATAPQFQQAYDDVVGNLRATISALRPVMLDYGLRAALDALADDLANRNDGLAVSLEVDGSAPRYDRRLEQHMYRIVQQACENALRHARPRTLAIRGHLAPDHIDLTVGDDGAGFEFAGPLDLAALVRYKHFGLAGMYERAALVEAQLSIETAPGRGTQVRVKWGKISRPGESA